ncbi:PH domain-containing protein [Humibacter sp. RRB41]|uniref:PH domain-containing protein n=1 Tax=Humibacter sp. RRB41 TaxID=2919946 RepID=UPI001FAA6220|nr:PH domain-containing protein [Humibacter sp. RRB41]
MTDTTPWRRLNPRMLLVHPVRELIKYLPILLLAVVAGSVGGEPWWTYVLSGLGVVIGLLRWFTTSYRITPTHVQVRRGFINRRMLSVPRERVRSVDVDATLLHRLVGLAVVKVGTSASHGQDGLDFDGIAAGDIPALRAELLRKAELTEEDGPGEAGGEQEAAGGMAGAQASGRDFSGWRWSWARYAPFTLTGVASLFFAAFFALELQFFDGGLLLRLQFVRDSIDTVSHIPLLEGIVGGAVILVVAASVIALVRYVLAYSGFAIWRSDATTLHVRHGLLRTRQVTLDERRLRGVSLNEPLSLRAVHGASAHAIMTGLGRERGGLMVIEPAGPQGDALRVATAVLGDETPLTCTLEQHGVRAHRRRYTRAATGVGLIAAIALVLQLLGYVSPLVWVTFAAIVPVAALLAEDRWRGLGHARMPGLLIARSGSLSRKRVVLETSGIIGFTVRRSIFQRRAGLATLIATTAAGRHRYSIPDVPIEEAWRIVDDVMVHEPVQAAVAQH